MTTFPDISSKINSLFGYSPTEVQLLQRPDLITIALDAIAANAMTLLEIATALNVLMGSSYTAESLKERPDLIRLGIQILATEASGGAIADGSITTAKYADQSVTPAKLSRPYTQGSPFTLSGVAYDVTSIPSWATEVNFLFADVSTSGISDVILQLGTASGVENTDYTSSTGQISDAVCASTFSTDGLQLFVTNNAANLFCGEASLRRLSAASNLWVMSVVSGRQTTGRPNYGAARKYLAASLDRLRITTKGGIDTIDSGVGSISWQ